MVAELAVGVAPVVFPHILAPASPASLTFSSVPRVSTGKWRCAPSTLGAQIF